MVNSILFLNPNRKMRTIALFTGLLISQFAISQNFISENKSWHVRDEFWGSVNTWIYKIGGDTVINSVNYKKLWSTTDSTMANLWLGGFIREESDVVFYRHLYSDNEGILYDFNLESGDTTYIINDYCDEQMVVITNIDTVEFCGVERKRWTLTSWWGVGEDYWLEGIGSICGPVHTLFSECTWDVWFELLCFHENDTLFYILPWENDCFQTSISIGEEADESHLMIKPNPVVSGSHL